MTNVTEIDVARALDGDRDALTRLVQRVHQPVFWLALRFFGNRADAQDASKEALIQIVTRLDRFSGRSATETRKASSSGGPTATKKKSSSGSKRSSSSRSGSTKSRSSGSTRGPTRSR